MINKSDSLTPDVLAIVQQQQTEPPNSGVYTKYQKRGSYLCRRCGLALFRSSSKFLSGCGWPSFDEEISGSIKRLPDKDGRRTEICCARCDAHLGHVFLGEGFTQKNQRHCVNSLAIDFVASTTITDSEEAIFAAGCFWGVQTLFDEHIGVVKTEVGYTGGDLAHPSYEQICTQNTGHLEALRVLYDPSKTNYQHLCRYFFEIHDATQTDGQGPDRGSQYLSAIFHFTEEQQAIAEQTIDELRNRGLNIATQIRPVTIFWPAEEYHQNYYQKTGKQPYCHIYRPLFDKHDSS